MYEPDTEKDFNPKSLIIKVNKVMNSEEITGKRNAR